MLTCTRKGELITELCFVVAGSLEVVQDGEILAFLGRSVYFYKTILGFCSVKALENNHSTGMMCVEIPTGKNQNKVYM